MMATTDIARRAKGDAHSMFRGAVSDRRSPLRTDSSSACHVADDDYRTPDVSSAKSCIARPATALCIRAPARDCIMTTDYRRVAYGG